MSLPVASIIFSPHTPPEKYVPLAQEAERLGLSEVWVWEDCFYESGIAAAAAILSATQQITVGVGLLPVPLRAVSLTAMEVATVARMFPGRFVPGVGHGVLEWMAQAGVRVASPMTLLREQTVALRRLLAGEEVSTSGRYVNLDRVRLNWPPSPTPPVLVGAVGAKTLALAGEVGDGVILVGELPPEGTRQALDTALSARREAGVEEPFDVVQFSEIAWDASAGEVRDLVAAFGEAGATRVPFLTLDSQGKPDPYDGIGRLMATIAAIVHE